MSIRSMIKYKSRLQVKNVCHRSYEFDDNNNNNNNDNNVC